MELKNRFVVPPMGTNYGNYDGFVTDEMIEYYRRRAAGGDSSYNSICNL